MSYFSHRRSLALGLLAVPALMQTACSNFDAMSQVVGWETLLDGTKGMENWSTLGDANWRAQDGAIQADKGAGFLVTRRSYDDVIIRVEFWADEDANSGIFMRMSDATKVNASNSYEINIYDKRPGQEYSTGAIVDFAKVTLPAPKAANRWNVYEITAKGNQINVTLNGIQTVSMQNSKFARGPFSLQYAPGVVKDKGVIRFRKVQIKQI